LAVPESPTCTEFEKVLKKGLNCTMFEFVFGTHTTFPFASTHAPLKDPSNLDPGTFEKVPRTGLKVTMLDVEAAGTMTTFPNGSRTPPSNAPPGHTTFENRFE
jgi:hypothetical protein